jgi:hypothetical protein
MAARSDLEKALARGLRPGGKLSDELDRVGDAPLSLADARTLGAALAGLDARALEDSDSVETNLHALTALFQQVDSREVFELLARDGIPYLLRFYDAGLRGATAKADDLLFLLKIFAFYRDRQGLQRILAAARRPLEPNGYLWSVVFQAFDNEHPLRHELLEGLRAPLPAGFIGVAYLDFANQVALAGELEAHPFDTPAGKARLLDWLSSSNAEEFSYAHSATAALPFVGEPERDQLLALALDHPDVGVQMEAAWVSARLGGEAGVKFLTRFCRDPNWSKTAQAYLRDLGREDAVPAEATRPDFQAMAEMCSWLAHPMEFGRPPGEIALYDTRELYWPPTNDLRRVWLFRYRYPAEEGGGNDDVGVGMVGSITFALFGETTPGMPPEDVYALHCCWELECKQDPRAPKQRSVKAGRRLLLEGGSRE